jgi:hypothetical protein
MDAFGFVQLFYGDSKSLMFVDASEGDFGRDKSKEEFYTVGGTKDEESKKLVGEFF